MAKACQQFQPPPYTMCPHNIGNGNQPTKTATFLITLRGLCCCVVLLTTTTTTCDAIESAVSIFPCVGVDKPADIIMC